MKFADRMISTQSVFFLPGTVLGRPGVARITDEQAGRVRLALDDDPNSGVWVPRESLSRSIEDLRGHLAIPSGSGDPALEAVARGEYTYLGKGDDGLCVLVPSLQEVVKAASTAPRRPFLDDHRTTQQADRELETQCRNADGLRALGVPVVPHRFVSWAGRSYQVTPFLTIPHTLTPQQLKAVEKAMAQMHAKGWALRDRPQIGEDAQGNFFLFDTGKSSPDATPEEILTDRKCLERLRECNQAVFLTRGGLRAMLARGTRVEHGDDILTDDDEAALDRAWARRTTPPPRGGGVWGGADEAEFARERWPKGDPLGRGGKFKPGDADAGGENPSPAVSAATSGRGQVGNGITQPTAEELAGATFEEIPGLDTLNAPYIRKVILPDGRNFFWKGMEEHRVAGETTAADLARICGLDSYKIWAADTPSQAPARVGERRGVIAEWVEVPTVANLIGRMIGDDFTLNQARETAATRSVLAECRPGEADRHALFNFLTAMPDRHLGNVAVRGDRISPIDHEFFAFNLEDPDDPCQYLTNTFLFKTAYDNPESHEFDPALVKEMINAVPAMAARVRQTAADLATRARSFEQEDADLASQCHTASSQMTLEAKMIEQRGSYLKVWLETRGPLDTNRLTDVMTPPLVFPPPSPKPAPGRIHRWWKALKDFLFDAGDPLTVQIGFQDRPLATGTLNADGTITWKGDGAAALVIRYYQKPGMTGEELLETLLTRLQGRWWCVPVTGDTAAQFARERWPKGTPGGLGGKWKPGTGAAGLPPPGEPPSDEELAQARVERVPGLVAQGAANIRKVTTPDGREFFWKGTPEYTAVREQTASDMARLCGLDAYNSHVIDSPPGGGSHERGTLTGWVDAPTVTTVLQDAGFDDASSADLSKILHREILSKCRPGEVERHALFNFLTAQSDRHVGNLMLRGDRLTSIDHEFFGDGKANVFMSAHRLADTAIFMMAHPNYLDHPFDPAMVREMIQAVPKLSARASRAASQLRARAVMLLHADSKSAAGLECKAASGQMDNEAVLIEQRGLALKKWLAESQNGVSLTARSLIAQNPAPHSEFASERWPAGTPGGLGGQFKPGDGNASGEPPHPPPPQGGGVVAEPPSSAELAQATFEKVRGINSLHAPNIRKVTMPDGRTFFWKGVPELKSVREVAACDLARLCGLDAYITWAVDTPPGAREAAESARGMLAEWVDSPSVSAMVKRAGVKTWDVEAESAVVRGILAKCRPGEADRHALFSFLTAMSDRHLGNVTVRGDRITTVDHEDFGDGRSGMPASFGFLLTNQLFQSAHDNPARHHFDPAMVREMINVVPAMFERTRQAASELWARSVFLLHQDPRSREGKQCRHAAGQMGDESKLIEQRGRAMERWLASGTKQGGELTANSLLNEISGQSAANFAGPVTRVLLGFQDRPLATGTLNADGTVTWEGDGAATAEIVAGHYRTPGMIGEEWLRTLLERLRGRSWCVPVDDNNATFARERWPKGTPGGLGGRFKSKTAMAAGLTPPPPPAELDAAAFELLPHIVSEHDSRIGKLTMPDGRNFFWKGVLEETALREVVGSDLARIAGLDAYATHVVDTPPSAVGRSLGRRGMLAEWVDVPTVADMISRHPQYGNPDWDPHSVVRDVLKNCPPGEADRHALFNFLTAMTDRHLANVAFRNGRLATIDHEEFAAEKADLPTAVFYGIRSAVFRNAYDDHLNHPFDPSLVKEMVKVVPAMVARTHQAASDLAKVADADPSAPELMNEEASRMIQRGELLKEWLNTGGPLTMNTLMSIARGKT